MPHEKTSEQDSQISSAERRAYSIIEFGQLFGISRSLVYTLIDRGEVRPVKILGRTAFLRGEVDRFAAALEAQVASGKEA